MTEFKEQLGKLHDEAFAWALVCTNGNRVDAEDVLQSVYLKIVEGKAVFNERSSLKTWLFAVIRHTARTLYRKRSYRKLLLLQWAPEPENTEILDSEAHDSKHRRVTQALTCLSQRQREVLELVFYHDQTIEEAAQILGISLGSARTHYHRGKTQMINLLQSEEQPCLSATITN